MKKKKDKIREQPRTRLKRTRTSNVSRQMNLREPDPWKELSLKLQPLSRAYRNFREKWRIAKQKEERRKFKDEEDQKIREEEAQRLMQQEERRLKKETKLIMNIILIW